MGRISFLLIAVAAVAASRLEPGDIVVRGGKLIDGSGGKPRKADLRISGDRISEIGKVSPRPGDTVISAKGLVLAPGFIDLHNHSTAGLEAEPQATSQISQGITTILVGADGTSPPVAEFLARMETNPPSLDVSVLVGHGTLRRQVMGEDYRRPATAEEIQKMAQGVEEAMRAGAFGLSTGLEYDPGFYSTTEELVDLARVAARFGGFYMSHIRDEADRTLEALAEAVEIGRRAQIAVEISHLKLGTVGVWGKTREAVALLEKARAEGVDVTADCYPYEAWSSDLSVLVPSRRFDDREAVAKGLADVGGAANILLTHCPADPSLEFKTLEAAAREKGSDPEALFTEIVAKGGASVVCRSMRPEDVRAFYRQPWVMVASDGGIGMRHPRAAGAFPRVLGRLVRAEKLMKLEEAVRKMTSLPASRLRLSDRGFLRPGLRADLVVFDPKRVIDRSTFQDPGRLSEGIERVYVAGVAVWEEGRATGARPGRRLRRGAPRPGSSALPGGS